MPILELEPSVFPADLFDRPAEWPGSDEPWSVLHTRPRAEKATARWLHNHGVSFFLPLFEHARRIQRRLVRSYVPLFPGYVFLRGGEEARHSAFIINQVVRCLRVPDQQRLSCDLRQVFQLIESGEPLAPEERIEPGAPAEIVHGPLAGHRGIVVRRAAGLRFIMAVDFLQRGASIEVDSTMIRPL